MAAILKSAFEGIPETHQHAYVLADMFSPHLLQKYAPKITKVSYQTPKTDKRLGAEVGG